MLRTKIPMRRKVPVLSGQKVAFIDAGELNPGLPVFLHLKQKPMDKAVECKDHEVAGCKDQEAVECKDHEAAGDTSPSNTTQAKAEDMVDIPRTTPSKAEDMEQNPSTSTNPNGQYISQHQVSQLQEIAKEPKTSEEPVETGKRGQFIITQVEEEGMKQNPSGSNPTGPNTSQHQVSLLQELAKEPKSADISPREDPEELEERGLFITEQQMGQIQELGDEQERVSKILENLALKIKNILADIQGKDASLGKWPQFRRKITGIIMAVIVALFIAVAVCLFSFLYPKQVETPVPTWWEYFTSIAIRFLNFY